MRVQAKAKSQKAQSKVQKKVQKKAPVRAGRVVRSTKKKASSLSIFGRRQKAA
jgi:hypothetical protein